MLDGYRHRSSVAEGEYLRVISLMTTNRSLQVPPTDATMAK